MAMGTRKKRQRQEELWYGGELPTAPGHPFYKRLNEVLENAQFDSFCATNCATCYHNKLGRPSLPPGQYFRVMMIGFFEGLDSERGIAWRLADSLTLRQFLSIGLDENTPDHVTISRTRRLIDAETHQLAQKREPTWRSAGRTAVRSEDSPGQRLSGAGHAERSMSDARGHKHRAANGRRAGAVPHGEAKAWLVRQGRGGRKEANPRTTSVWNPLLLFDLASTTSSTLGKSGPSALSRLRPRRPQGLFFDFGLEGPRAKRDR